MRKFGTQTPEVMEFTLGNSKKVHRLPLAASMPMATSLRFAEVAAMPDGEAKNLAAARLQFEMLREHIGEAADTLTTDQVAEVFEAWGQLSSEQGADAGE